MSQHERRKKIGDPKPLTPDDVYYLDKGLQLARDLQRQYGVQRAEWTHPRDLAIIGIISFAGDEISDIKTLDPHEYATAVANGYSQKFLDSIGTTREEMVRLYPEIVGLEGGCATGYIAQSIIEMRETLPREDVAVLENRFAILGAGLLKAEPSVVPYAPGIRYSKATQQLFGRDGVVFPGIDVDPDVVIEYGPGIVAHWRIPDETRQTPLTIFIEKSQYKNQLLFQLAGLYGLNSTQPPFQVITRMDGIKSSTEELVTLGNRNIVDLVIASMIHGAGDEAVAAGFRNAREVLKPGGLVAVQAAQNVDPGEVQGDIMFQMAREHFGEPRIFRPIDYIRQRTSAREAGFEAVFVK